ncbi:hypothetical protein [Neobacillus sp. PS3-40]|jgi:hypothetical protein|uniref:hypothetical protein n=1 Tax=Neobacillus sp. PS3-40 TaxID=3070679 RepID=UPI0027DF8C8C|nr:hypothetical protein [Neobacillus sp. PS3-40]WML44521.1 hypothetical protein RCG20_00990 [Neobacillus sp. PS3-40]
MNELAENLNEILKCENPFIYDMLSNLEKNLYYPKGILSQSAEASKKAYRFNATIGIATEGNNPMYFQHIQDHFMGYSPSDIYPYTPPAGKLALREAWKEKLQKDNPSIENKKIGLLRIAFSCVEEQDIEELFAFIYQGVKDLLEEVERD